MAVSTGLQVIGQMSQANQQQQWADYQAAQARADANAQRQFAEIRAEKIRRAGRRQQGEARAALAGAGVETGAGTAVVIDQQIVHDTEMDAQQALIEGMRRANLLERDAAEAEWRGENASRGSLLAAGGTLATGWRPSSLRVNDPSNYRDS